MTFSAIVNRRVSNRVFGPAQPEDSAVIRKNLELAMLSPSSSNMQLWEFYQLESPEMKAKITEACLGQSAARTASQLVVFVTRQDKWPQRAQWNLNKIKEGRDPNREPNVREKRVDDYYGKLMKIAYGNDWFGLLTFFRGCVNAFFKITGKPIAKIITRSDQRIVVHKSCALAAQTFMLGMAADDYDTCPMEGFDVDWVRRILKLPAGADVNMIIACGKGQPEGIWGPRMRVPANEVIFSV